MKAFGWCPYCRHSRQLRGDGRVRMHKQPRLAPGGVRAVHEHWCPGSGEKPYRYPEDNNGPAPQLAGQQTIDQIG